MAEVPEIAVHAVNVLFGYGHVYAARRRVVNFILAGFYIPYAPGRYYFQVGSKRFNGQLKTHLVVALAGAAVADGVGTFLDGDVGQSLCDAGTCKAGAQQIVLVLGAELQGGEDVVLDEVLLQVEDVQLGSAGSLSLLFQTVQMEASVNDPSEAVCAVT